MNQQGPTIMNFLRGYTPLIMVVIFLASLATGWKLTADSYTSKQTNQTQKRTIVNQKAQIVAAEVGEKVTVKYVEKIKIVKQKGEDIIREVPVYVTEQADADCSIDSNFGVLWNAANRGEVPEASAVTDATPNTYKLSDVAAQHAKEVAICRATEEQLISLQEYLKSLPTIPETTQ